MKILIAVVSSAKQLSGVPRHAANMARSLLTRPEVEEVHLVAAPWQYELLRDAIPTGDPRFVLHAVPVGNHAWSRNLWYYIQLPKLAVSLHVDLVHLACPMPVNRRAFACPVVVTLHDMYPYDIPENFGFPKVVFNRLVLGQCMRAVDAIACVSESTLSRLDVYGPMLALEKATVIYNSIEAGPSPAPLPPIRNWNGEPFLLCVAQHRRNKNILLALKVFRRLLHSQHVEPTTRLILVGMEGPETRRIRRLIADEGLTRQVDLIQGVSEAELQWCYAHCELLLAPSTVEGFGLPIVEATMHHCRIVCSDIPAFREVGGSHCRYVSLKAPAEDAFVLATAMALKDNRFRMASTDRFSDTRAAEAYLKLYRSLRHRTAATNTGQGRLVPAMKKEH